MGTASGSADGPRGDVAEGKKERPKRSGELDLKAVDTVIACKTQNEVNRRNTKLFELGLTILLG